MSDPTNDGMLREWGTRLFYGMPKKGKPQRGRMPLVVGAAMAAAVLSGTEVRQRVRAAIRPSATQVVVKITGGGRGMLAIAAHMRYISRQGKPEVGGRGESLNWRTKNGETISGSDAIMYFIPTGATPGATCPTTHGAVRPATSSSPCPGARRHVMSSTPPESSRAKPSTATSTSSCCTKTPTRRTCT